MNLSVWLRGKKLPMQVTMEDAIESMAKKVVDTVGTSVNRLGVALCFPKRDEQRTQGSPAALFINKVSGAADRAGKSVALLLVRDGERIYIPLRFAALSTT